MMKLSENRPRACTALHTSEAPARLAEVPLAEADLRQTIRWQLPNMAWIANAPAGRYGWDCRVRRRWQVDGQARLRQMCRHSCASQRQHTTQLWIGLLTAAKRHSDCRSACLVLLAVAAKLRSQCLASAALLHTTIHLPDLLHIRPDEHRGTPRRCPCQTGFL